MNTEWIQKLTNYRERQDQILEIYEAGVSVKKISSELHISRARTYQIINRAKKRREETRLVQKETVEVNE